MSKLKLFYIRKDNDNLVPLIYCMYYVFKLGLQDIFNIRFHLRRLDRNGERHTIY